MTNTKSQFHLAQPQRVADNRHAAQAHCCRRDHRTVVPVNATNARGDRHAGGIVREREKRFCRMLRMTARQVSARARYAQISLLARPRTRWLRPCRSPSRCRRARVRARAIVHAVAGHRDDTASPCNRFTIAPLPPVIVGPTSAMFASCDGSRCGGCRR